MTNPISPQLVIGLGEVGTALAKVIGCDSRDLEPTGPLATRYDVLHIAFGYNAAFEDQVRTYQRHYDAAIVLVHSTVKPGTCEANGWTYSPITGRHPHLEHSIRTITKPVAGPDTLEVAMLLRDAGIPAEETTDTTTELEAAKLVDLLVYGANIRIAKEVERWCRDRGLDYDRVFRDSARRYNAAYDALGDDRFRRYDLAHVPGEISGHCVGFPNLALWGDERLEALVRPATKEYWDGELD